jgi:hypothetical protein
MATLALPIRELGQSVGRAQAETERVIGYSRARESLRVTCQIIGKTLGLRVRFSNLAKRQDSLLQKLTDVDFARFDASAMVDLATSLDELVTGERDMLVMVESLGAEIRIWWRGSIERLTEQTDHLDSIAESLRVATDSECSALMALAMEQFSSHSEPVSV